MANKKQFVVKNGLATNNISFVDRIGNPTSTIDAVMSSPDVLAFQGDSGEILYVADITNGTVFSLNGASGTPSIEVDSTGEVRLVETSGNVLVGTSIDNGADRLQVAGSISATAFSGDLDYTDITNPPVIGDGVVTVTGGDALTGSGTFSLNDVANTSITIDHADTSTQTSVSNTGNTVVQSVTLDDYGHITALTSKAITFTDVGGLGADEKAVDSDLLDGLDSTQFLRSDQTDTMTGSLTITDSLTVSTDALHVDATNGRIGVGTVSPSSALDVVGDVAVSGTVDGRDVAADGSKLDTIETNADVTDTTNVTAAGAVMDSELTDEQAVKDIDQALATTASPAFSGVSVDQATLRAIAETKTDNAVDVFVYDTSRDSDGGAWRHRCQHTSWYNEPLNTATRGARREFPAVAVIVAEANRVTIYDGDDPAMPMWMVFSTISGSLLRSPSLTCVEILNGRMAVGHADGGGFHLIYFIKDTARWLTASGSYGGFYQGGGIGNRNTGGANYLNNVLGASDITLAYSVANDVAMTVLPNAPIDPATGLPVPTIAVATYGGVSIIKDDGTVVDSENTQIIDYVHLLDNYLYWGVAFSSALLRRTPIVGLSDNFSYESLPESTYSIRGMRHISGHENIHLGGNSGTNDGVAILRPNDSYSDTMFSRITSTYNTGWMPGDIKLAALSDTDTTNLVGSGELVTNGTFDVDVSGWTAKSSTLLQENGQLKIVGNSTAEYAGAKSAAFNVIVGQEYTLSVSIGDVIGDIRYAVAVRRVDTESNIASITRGANNTYVVTFTATHPTVFILLESAKQAGVTAYFDNISVKLADNDRSVNNNGLIVNGTVTREPVAPGSDLVAYTGFRETNYLEQPYNPDLDFGTGDCCIMGWVKTSTVNVSQKIILHRGNASRTGGLFEIRLLDNNRLRVVFSSDGYTAGSIFETDNSLPVEWCFLCVVRKTTSLDIIINDRVSSYSITAQDVTNTEAVLGIGIRPGDLVIPFSLTGSGLSLFRISATAPSSEQIKKIYDDEKVLFQENAQATLYGSSDAVTALVHDEVTDLLHVGTSAGRSVFQGLRRVDNTTDPVTTAISAHNGLIAEQ